MSADLPVCVLAAEMRQISKFKVLVADIIIDLFVFKFENLKNLKNIFKL